MTEKEQKETIVNTVLEYAEGKYHLDITIHDLHIAADRIVKLFAIPIVSNCPSELDPVLAKIEHINDLGKSKWHEVVYFDDNWRSYSGSKTFEDGEKVVKWRYCKDCC